MRREWAWANTGKVRQGPRPRRQNLANETAFLFSGHNEATLCSQVNSRGPGSAVAMCLERPGCLCASHSSELESCVTWGNSLNLSVPRDFTILHRWAAPRGNGDNNGTPMPGTALQTTRLHTRSAYNSVWLWSAAVVTAICTTLLKLTFLRWGNTFPIIL